MSLESGLTRGTLESREGYARRRQYTKEYITRRIKLGFPIWDGNDGIYINPQRQMKKQLKGNLSARQFRKLKHN